GRWRRCRARSCETTRTDADSPGATVGGQILVDVTERGVIDWIDDKRSIVAPAVATSLRCRPINNGSFPECHLAGRITVVSGCVIKAGKHGWISSISGTEAEGHIAE